MIITKKNLAEVGLAHKFKRDMELETTFIYSFDFTAEEKLKVILQPEVIQMVSLRARRFFMGLLITEVRDIKKTEATEDEYNADIALREFFFKPLPLQQDVTLANDIAKDHLLTMDEDLDTTNFWKMVQRGLDYDVPGVVDLWRKTVDFGMTNHNHLMRMFVRAIESTLL